MLTTEQCNYPSATFSKLLNHAEIQKREENLVQRMGELLKLCCCFEILLGGNTLLRIANICAGYLRISAYISLPLPVKLSLNIATFLPEFVLKLHWQCFLFTCFYLPHFSLSPGQLDLAMEPHSTNLKNNPFLYTSSFFSRYCAVLSCCVFIPLQLPYSFSWAPALHRLESWGKCNNTEEFVQVYLCSEALN